MDTQRVDGKHLRKLQNKLNGLFISPENAPEFYDYMNQPKFKLTTYDQRNKEIDLLEDVVKTWDGVDHDSAGEFWEHVRELNYQNLQSMNASSKKAKRSKRSKKAKRSKKGKKAKRSKRSKTSRRMRRKTR